MAMTCMYPFMSLVTQNSSLLQAGCATDVRGRTAFCSPVPALSRPHSHVLFGNHAIGQFLLIDC